MENRDAGAGRPLSVGLTQRCRLVGSQHRAFNVNKVLVLQKQHDKQGRKEMGCLDGGIRSANFPLQRMPRAAILAKHVHQIG